MSVAKPRTNPTRNHSHTDATQAAVRAASSMDMELRTKFVIIAVSSSWVASSSPRRLSCNVLGNSPPLVITVDL